MTKEVRRAKPTARHVSSVCKPECGIICGSLIEENGDPECASKEKKDEDRENDNCSGPPSFLITKKSGK